MVQIIEILQDGMQGPVNIAGTLGRVSIDTETHESGVTKCMTGEAWSAFSWHHSSVYQSCRITDMAADDLVKQGARTIAAMVWTWLSRSIPVSVPEGFILLISMHILKINYIDLHFFSTMS